MKRQNIDNVNTAELFDKKFKESPHEHNAHPYLGNILSKISHGNVLDVGCYFGNYIPYFKHCEVFGIDISPEAIKYAVEKYPNAKFTVGDFVKNKLPYDDSSFNFIFIGEVIEHLEQPEKIIEECFRVLKVGGIISVTCPYKDMIKCPEHLWEYDEQDLLKLFSKFKDISIVRYGIQDYEHFLLIGEKQ